MIQEQINFKSQLAEVAELLIFKNKTENWQKLTKNGIFRCF
jgi:hypothetical protein